MAYTIIARGVVREVISGGAQLPIEQSHVTGLEAVLATLSGIERVASHSAMFASIEDNSRPRLFKVAVDEIEDNGRTVYLYDGTDLDLISILPPL